MLVIARALLARPRVLLLDEPSLGLAPRVMAQVMDLVVRLSRENGITIVLVEQNARGALAIADHGVVLNLGRVVAPRTRRRSPPTSRSVTTISGSSHQGGMPVVEFLQFTLSGISLRDDLRRGGAVLVLIWRGTRLLNLRAGRHGHVHHLHSDRGHLPHRLLLGRLRGRAGGGHVLGAVCQLTDHPADHEQAAAQRGDRDHRAARPPGGPGRHLLRRQYRSFPAAFSVTG
jgi:hypothetical protein